MLKKILCTIMCLLAGPVQATTYFSVPNVVTDPWTCGSGCAASLMANFNNLIANGNTGYTALLAAITALGGAGPPAGMVAMFNTASTQCPTGWVPAAPGYYQPNTNLDVRGFYIRGLDTGGIHGPVTQLGFGYGDTIQDHHHSWSTVNFNNSSLAGTAGTGFFTVTSFAQATPAQTGFSQGGFAGNETRPISFTYTACIANGANGEGTPFTFSSPPVTLVNGNTILATQVMQNYNQIVNDGNTAYNSVAGIIAGLSVGAMPSGAVMPFDLPACPTGWVIADGSGGTVDLRGYFPRVWNFTGVGPDAGRGQDTVQGFALQQHTHSTPTGYLTFATSTGVSNTGVGSGYISTSFSAFTNTGNIASLNGSGTAGTETRPKFIALLFCEKS